jgi:hypothetical protein
MTKTVIVLSLVALGAGCDQRQDLGSNPDVPEADARAAAAFENFSAVTRAATYVDDGQGYHWDLSLMATDGTGAIGCSLADPSASPGQSVSRVSFTLKGDFARAPICGPQAQAIGSEAVGRFERWDDAGTKTDNVVAIGGAASFASSSAGVNLYRCDVTVTLTFPGGALFTDSFSYNYDTQDAVTESCLQGEACSCESWQSCDAQRQCVDLACVPAKVGCPSDGSVACCAGAGSCTGGVCCVDAGNPCNPNASTCCYSCDFLDNQIYHGYYCTHP